MATWRRNERNSDVEALNLEMGWRYHYPTLSFAGRDSDFEKL